MDQAFSTDFVTEPIEQASLFQFELIIQDNAGEEAIESFLCEFDVSDDEEE